MKTAPFSGGEKSRLALALLAYQRPNLLLLDEPTNHLDLEMRQALATALQDFDGAMVIVSHDRHLLRVATDNLLLVHDQIVTEFNGSLDDYPDWLNQQQRSGESRPAGNGGQSAIERKIQKQREAEKRQLLAPLRKRMQQYERELETLQSAKAEIEARLTDSELYGQDRKTELQGLLATQAENTQSLERIEQQWLQACEELEQLQS